jgi:hypothetical protein
VPLRLKGLAGIAIAMPVGLLALVWYLENVYSSGCTTTVAGQGVIQGNIGYKTTRLRCSRVDDEFMTAVGPPDGMAAAIATVKFKPEFVRAENAHRAIFAVDGRDLAITLDSLGRPVERIDVEAGGRRSATPHPR